MSAKKSIWDIPRNDPDACDEYQRSRGGITEDEAAIMIQLQDDPAELIKRMRDWPSREPRDE